MFDIPMGRERHGMREDGVRMTCQNGTNGVVSILKICKEQIVVLLWMAISSFWIVLWWSRWKQLAKSLLLFIVKKQAPN
jgi:hypothetical protein